MLAGHRAYVTSMFFDLRGFTSFTELAEPEELFEVLREYHVGLGELIPRVRRHSRALRRRRAHGLLQRPRSRSRSTSSRPCSSPSRRRSGSRSSASTWRKRGHELGLGIGIAAGYATLGRIGFEGRYDYGVLGTVTNLASRLSSAAEPGQTLISQRVFAAVEESRGRSPSRRARAEGLRPADAGLRGPRAEAVNADAPRRAPPQLHRMGRRPREAHPGNLGPRIRPAPLSGAADRGVEDRGRVALSLGAVADLPPGDGTEACKHPRLARQGRPRHRRVPRRRA